MGWCALHHHGNIPLLLLLSVTIFTNSCQGNRVGYKHLQLGRDEILVDQIIPLEEKEDKQESTEESVEGNTERKEETNTVERGEETDIFVDTVNVYEDKKDQVIENLYKEIDKLKRELRKMQKIQEIDREISASLDKKMDKYHTETIISNAEVVQIRQLVAENFDKIVTLQDVAKDISLTLEGMQIFQKDATRDLRRFREYKERAAKRFHQLENHVERLQKYDNEVKQKLDNVTQEIKNLTNGQLQLRNISSVFNETLHKSINESFQCCIKSNQTHTSKGSQHQMTGDYNSANQNREKPESHNPPFSTITNQEIGHSQSHNSPATSTQSHDIILTNQISEYSKFSSNSGSSKTDNSRRLNEIEIIDFGSGETSDKYMSHFEEKTNEINGKQKETHNIQKFSDNIFEGSGESVFSSVEGSGEPGSGAIDELIPVTDLSRFMEVKVFQREIATRDNTIQDLVEKNENLTSKLLTLEDRVASIHLGSFMKNLQDSLLNFTQNVITLDQWKMSSTQIVNSTLNNQDQIFKLTSMILENADQIKDMKWKISNTELVSDQQFRILRMHIVRLNNTVEDMREQLLRLEKFGVHSTKPGYQSSFYGYQTYYQGSRPHSTSTNNDINENQSTDHNGISTLLARLDELGLQIVYNQNRLGNLEVKVLNETLYQCQKQSMDTYQDTQISQLESMLKTTIESLSVTNDYLRDVDKAINDINDSIRATQRRVRSNSANVATLRKLIPIVVSVKKETDNFKFQLPSDCQEYHERGYKKAGVYVIHPIGANKSSHVTCYFDQSGGWTVLQQRFDGTENFRRTWNSYKDGFGDAESEYWIGNEIIYLLTSNKNYSLRIDMTDLSGNDWQANYEHFFVSSPQERSTLTVSGFYGNITDSFSYSDSMSFSTPDNDNDASSTNCGYFYEAGWWYKHCQTCNLNGRYDIGFLWFDMTVNDWVQLKASTMKIIPS